MRELSNAKLRPPAFLIAILLLALSAVALSQGNNDSPISGSSPTVVPLSANQIVRRAMEHDVSNWQKETNYTFVQRIEQRELNSDGSTKSTKSETEEIIFLYGQPYAHLIKRNDQPLSESEARKAEKKLNDTMEKRRQESPADRHKRLADFEKRHHEEHSFLLEVPEAYDFRILREETVNGRPAYVVAGEPRQSFRPRLNAARVLPKLRPKLWIGKENFEWLRLEAEVIDTITWGGFLLRLHPGSHIELEQTLVNNEAWLPRHAHISFDARIALLKSMRLEVDAQFSDYKKFRTDSRILSVEEAPH